MTETGTKTQASEMTSSGVQIVGTLPNRPGRPRLMLLFANTHTERRILQSYIDEHFAGLPEDERPCIAWFAERQKGDDLVHEGLAERIGVSETLDIVPIGVVWKPKSQDHQSWLAIHSWMRLVKSNWRQRVVLKKSPERAAIVVGEFGTLKALQAKYDSLAAETLAPARDDLNLLANFIALEAAVTIERDSRRATGDTVKYPRHARRSIWGRPHFQAQLSEIAKETGKSLESVKAEARACLKELVPNIQAPHVSLSGSFARKVSSLGYEKDLVYDKAKMHDIRELALTKPTALVWTHKTHIDGFAILLSTQDESFPLVHTIGGNNMAFLGVGYLMSRAGTIFIRRKMDSTVYKTVLRFYLTWLLEKRFPVSWALEGTRSRNGKLMPPRFGILKYVVEAAANKNITDLNIVPVSIYYDLIAELGDYAREQSGTTKRRESISWFIGYLRSLRKPLGRISLGIGDPVVVDTTGENFKAALEAGHDSFSIELQKLAFEASVNANAVTPLTPSSIYSLVLTGAAPQALTESESTREMEALANWARERNLPMTEELQVPNAERVRDVARAMIEIGIVSRYDGGSESVYSIADGKHFEASYYRNNSIHFFVDKALIEVALLRVSRLSKAATIEAFWDAIKHIRDIFKFEFFYPDWTEHQTILEAELARSLPDWKTRLIAGEAQNMLKDLSPLVSHAVLRPFVEAYSIVADIILKAESGDELSQKSVVESALKLGKQAYLQRQITSEESIGKLMFSNGYQLADNRGLFADSADDNCAGRRAFLKEVKDVTQELKLLRGLAEEARESASIMPNQQQLRIVSET